MQNPEVPPGDKPTVPAHDNDPDEAKTFVTLELCDQLFALEVSCVREILDPQQLTKLPDAPHDLLGMIDVRGEAVVVLDIRAFPFIHEAYPAALKKFQHSSGVKRSQISPMASMS